MATHNLGRVSDLLRAPTAQARSCRPPAVRPRSSSSVVVRVASLLPSGPRGPKAASPSGADSTTSRGGPNASPADEQRPDNSLPELGAEDSANLQRIASSHQATTSDRATYTSTPRNSRSSGHIASGRGGSSGGSTPGARNGKSRLNRNMELEPRGFTFLLSSAASLDELQELFQYGLEKQALNDIHIATTWSRLAKLVIEDAEDGQLQQQQPLSGEPSSNSGSGGGTTEGSSSNSSAQGKAQTTSQSRPLRRRLTRIEPAALASFLEALEAATTPGQLGLMQARSLATVIWAAAKITYQTSQNPPMADSPAPGPEQASSGPAGKEEGSPDGDAEGQPQPPAERPRPLRIRGGRTALEAAKAAAAAAAAKESGRGRLVSQAFLDSWAAAADSKLSTFNMQDVSNVVWALGRLDFEPQGLFMRRLTVALLKELPRADRPQQLSNTLLGFALLRFVPPVKDFFEPVWAALNRLVLAEQRTPDVQAVSNSLWSIAQLVDKCPDTMAKVPSDVVSKAVFRAVQWGDRMNGTQVQDVLTSLPHLGFLPSEYQAMKLWQLAERVIPVADGTALSNIMMALLQIKARPGTRLRKGILAAFRRRLPDASLEAVTRILYCLGVMRVQANWMPLIWTRLMEDRRQLSAPDIAFTVMAIRRLYPEVLPPHMRPAVDADANSDADDQEEDGAVPRTAPRTTKAARRAAEGVVSDGFPTGQVLIALRRAWQRLGPEAQLSVVFDLRANVQYFLDAVPDYVVKQEKAARKARQAKRAAAAAMGAGAAAVDEATAAAPTGADGEAEAAPVAAPAVGQGAAAVGEVVAESGAGPAVAATV